MNNINKKNEQLIEKYILDTRIEFNSKTVPTGNVYQKLIYDRLRKKDYYFVCVPEDKREWKIYDVVGFTSDKNTIYFGIITDIDSNVLYVTTPSKSKDDYEFQVFEMVIEA